MLKLTICLLDKGSQFQSDTLSLLFCEFCIKICESEECLKKGTKYHSKHGICWNYVSYVWILLNLEYILLAKYVQFLWLLVYNIVYMLVQKIDLLIHLHIFCNWVFCIFLYEFLVLFKDIYIHNYSDKIQLHFILVTKMWIFLKVLKSCIKNEDILNFRNSLILC